MTAKKVRLSWYDLQVRLAHNVALGVEQARSEGLTRVETCVTFDRSGSVSALIGSDQPEQSQVRQVGRHGDQLHLFPEKS